jgi:hypothetical protein
MSDYIEKYPNYACLDCLGEVRKMHDKKNIRLHVSNIMTMYIVDCPICGKKSAGTELRDYGYPREDIINQLYVKIKKKKENLKYWKKLSKDK